MHHNPPMSATRPTSPDRPRIMAMESGPGPAAYGLPGTVGQLVHDISKKRAPAYTFGGQSKTTTLGAEYDKSPGPIYAIASCMTRKGKDGIPAYTLHSRTGISNINYSPGPAAYHTGLHHPTRGVRAPVYSFGLKTGSLFSKSTTPSPNSYTLSSLLGDKVVGKVANPSYSMTGRPKPSGVPQTPGPGAYKTVHTDTYRHKSPVYSMHIKGPSLGQLSTTPGPGSHRPELTTACHRQPPKFSFGIKHSRYTAPLIERFTD